MHSLSHFGAWWAWPGALALYVGFCLWYDNWRGPLTAQEVAHYMALAAAASGADHTGAVSLRVFLEADDGKEFVMCNLLRLHAQSVVHPVSGAATAPGKLLQQYVRAFVWVLLAHGGHPVVAVRKVGGYIDAWNTPPDPGWNIAGMMRYRSRRDLMQLATAPRFTQAYGFKAAALAETFSFPSRVVSSGVLRPRTAVALALALGAALVHLGSLLLLV